MNKINDIYYLEYDGCDELFIIQDIVYYLDELLSLTDSLFSLFLINGSINMNKQIFNAWFIELNTLCKNSIKKEQYEKYLIALKNISIGINYGIREYQIKNNVNSMLTDSYYDDEFLEKNKPFPVYVINNKIIHLEINKEIYNILKDALLFIIAFNTNDKDYLLSFFNKLFEIDLDYLDTCLNHLLNNNSCSNFYNKNQELIKELINI